MSHTHLPPDADGSAWAEACRRGDRRAQHALWEQYKNRMFGVCMRFAASRQEAEDLLQEAFVRVFRDIGQYRGEGSLEGWIRRITVRTALQHAQKHRMLVEPLDEAEWEHALRAADEALDSADADDPGRLVALLQSLPPGFRAVLNLYVIEERTHEDIAGMLGISVGTSKSQLHRAKVFLRRLLDKALLLL